MSLEKEHWLRHDNGSGELSEIQLWFKDVDGDKIRFDVDPDGELWVHMAGSIIMLQREDVEILLEKMLEAFALRVIT